MLVFFTTRDYHPSPATRKSPDGDLLCARGGVRTAVGGWVRLKAWNLDALRQQLDPDLERAIGVQRAAVTGCEREAVLSGCGTDERVVDGATGDAEFVQLDE
jgi:hypothetical protein